MKLALEQRVILAVDPGKETGWASLTLGIHSSGQMPLHKFLMWLDGALDAGLMPQIVCEDFIYTTETAKKSRQTSSTEGIGVLRFLALKHDLGFALQSPASAKKFATDDKLRKLNWYQPSKGGHANDASRHLLVFAAKHRLIDPAKML